MKTTVRQRLCSLLAGIVSGVMILGIGGKLVLKVMTIIANSPPTLSGEVAANVVYIAVVLGAIAGLLFPFAARPMSAFQGATGAAFGLLIYVAVIPMILTGMRENALVQSDWLPLSVAVFGLLFLGFGIVMEMLGNGLRSLSRIRIEKIFVQKV